jgi:hypothetical protein
MNHATEAAKRLIENFTVWEINDFLLSRHQDDIILVATEFLKLAEESDESLAAAMMMEITSEAGFKEKA